MKIMRNTVRFTGGMIRVVAKGVSKPIGAAIQSWKNVTPVAKKWIYRVTCGMILFYTLENRTMPMLGKKIESWATGIMQNGKNGIEYAKKFIKAMAGTDDNVISP